MSLPNLFDLKTQPVDHLGASPLFLHPSIKIEWQVSQRFHEVNVLFDHLQILKVGAYRFDNQG
jgi:hypothetical protein